MAAAARIGSRRVLLPVVSVAAFAVAMVPVMGLLEAKPAGTSFLAAVLVGIDAWCARWQIPNLRDAIADWRIGRDFPGWGRRRVFARYTANWIRTAVLPLAFVVALLVLTLPQRQVYQPDLMAALEGWVLSVYVLASELAFAGWAASDYYSRGDVEEEHARLADPASGR